MDLSSILALIAGIALFLYGMNLMGDGLKNAAGASLEHILQKLTNSRLKGFSLGVGVTAIIQSSAAAAIMCLGFVNAGMISLTQAVPVVIGSNIGSTMTGQILRLGDLGGGSFLLTLLKPASLAPLLIAYGVVVLCFTKSHKKRNRHIATVLLGLGLLFLGMSTMENAISPLKESESFRSLLIRFENPIIGILLGILVTAIVQSSSASVGMLQALSSTGIITWGMTIPIVIGQNIGKCLPVLLGGLGTTKDAKRLALSHLIVNVLGALVIGALIYAAKGIFRLSFFENLVNRGNIADFHTGYNIVMSLLLLPFSDQIVRLTQRLIKDTPEDLIEKHRLDQLDDLLLKTPLVALEAARSVAVKMGEAAKENFGICEALFHGVDPDKIERLEQNETFLDKAESKVSDYMVRINSGTLSAADNQQSTEILRSVSDFERIGDYAVNIEEMIIYNHENKITFSKTVMEEISRMNRAVSSILDTALSAFTDRDILIASRVEPLEQVIDVMKETMSNHHIERLKNNKCSVQAGISLTEYLNSVERISDHCSNIAVHTIRSKSQEIDFDTHSYLNHMHDGATEEYNALYAYYEQQYLGDLASSGKKEKKEEKKNGKGKKSSAKKK